MTLIFRLVMTTIGYGTAVPQSTEGRCMVFTLGFLSIIVFGMVSTRAAFVITTICDDMLVQARLRVLTKPWIQCLFWGLFYYTFLLLIAQVYVWWKIKRIGDDEVMPFHSAYWFSFLSTTTIGFGDYYLEEEFLQASDCVLFPIIFLLGFSVLASFLTKLNDLVRLPFRDGPSLSQRFRDSELLQQQQRA